MRRNKLPAPPGKGRPLPPEPARSMDDAPPPLPSRPGKPNLPKIPPPKQTDNQHCDDGDEYLEPEDWTSSSPPKIPPKNFTPECSDDDDCETYEEPNEPPSIPRHPPPAPQEQETYDDFEGMGTPGQADDDPGETYDACDVQTQPHSNDYAEDNIYEEGDVLPDPPDGELYEFMPEETTPAAPAKPPHHMSPGHAPSLPSRPPPSRQNDYDSGQDTPDPPGRPTAKIASVKSISGEGQISLGISLHELGARKANLKKVESTEDREQKVESPIEPSTGNMVKDRINKFKQAEKGIKPGITSPKPLLPVKPMATIHSTPKPSEAVKSPPPPTVVHKRDTSPPLPPPPNVDNFEESDDIYDEGFSFVPDPLSREEWYHGEIERNESTKKLQSIGQDGTFLVRKSKQGGDTQPYTLVVLYLGHVYNLKMRQRSDGQIALGESKPDELAFKDVPALIQHHKSHDVILVNVKDNKQHKTLLKKHPIAK